MNCRINEPVKLPCWSPRATVTITGDRAACILSEGSILFRSPAKVYVTVHSGGDMWQGEFVAEGEMIIVEQPVEQPEPAAEEAQETKEPEHAEEEPAAEPSGMGRPSKSKR